MGQDEEAAERLKHRYRVREVILDKGILAAVLAVLVMFTNARLAEYKAGLDERLAQLNTSRERQRVLAEREISAYETIWKALISLRRSLEPFYGQTYDAKTEAAVTRSILDFEQVLAAESIYLSSPLRDHLDKFVGETFPEAIVSWEREKASKLSPGIWNGLTGEMNKIGEEVRAATYERMTPAAK